METSIKKIHIIDSTLLNLFSDAWKYNTNSLKKMYRIDNRAKWELDDYYSEEKKFN